MKWSRLFCLVAFATILVSCIDADRATADRGVQTFHDHFNAGEFRMIYADATQEFQDATTADGWVKLLESVRSKAGAFKSTSVSSWRVDTGTAGTTVTAAYDTKFERLNATEHFSWRVSRGSALLLGYRIDSPSSQ